MILPQYAPPQVFALQRHAQAAAHFWICPRSNLYYFESPDGWSAQLWTAAYISCRRNCSALPIHFCQYLSYCSLTKVRTLRFVSALCFSFSNRSPPNFFPAPAGGFYMNLQKHIIYSANFLKKCLLFCMYKQRKILYNERGKSCISTFCTADFCPSKYHRARTHDSKYTTFTEKLQVKIMETALKPLSGQGFRHFFA